MRYLLDTNICSYVIKHRPLEVLKKFKTLQIDDCGISCITYSELKYWVIRNKRLHEKSQNQGVSKINEQVINDFVSRLNVVEFDTHAADVYAVVRDEIESKGFIIGNADLLIGAHAISLGVTLVTNNSKDFMNFPSIRLENWVYS